MSILDNKKKLKDTVDGYAITILKYKTSNKPNKFNSSSNELKKDYKKLTKLRKDLNDLDDSNEDDKEIKQFIKQVSLSVANSIKEYEQVLVENGESIMDPSIVNNSNDSDNVNNNSSSNGNNNNNNSAISNSNGNVANGAATSASALDSTKISKKEQRKLMKERKNQMKLQAKLAQQEAFNNKQIMITERSAKDIVIDIPEPTTGENEKDNSEENKKDNNETKKNDNDNVRVEHVPKSKKSEDKKKKKQQQQPPKSATTPSSSPFTAQLNTVSLSPATPLTRVKTADKLTEELLNKSRNQHSSTASSVSSSSAAAATTTTTNTNSAHSQQVEWGQLATQRKQKELQEKERELQEQEAAQLAAAQAASLAEQVRQQQNNLANPSVLLTRQLPQLNNREFLEETDETNYESNVSGYDSGKGCEYLVEGQKLIVNFDNKSNYGLVNNINNNTAEDLGLSGGLASIMKDYLASKTLFFQSNNSNTSKENNNSNLSQNNGTWFDFKSYDSLNSDKNGEYTNGINSNNNSSSNNNAGSNGGDQGIVITGRRQDKEDGNDSEKGVQTQREAQLNIFSPPRQSFVRFFIEQC